MKCDRCGGFVVFDTFSGVSPCAGFRCINCGAVSDMRVIVTRPPQRDMRKTSQSRSHQHLAALKPTATARG